MAYMVVDRNGEPLHEGSFPTEREAYKAKRVYEDNCYEPGPYKVVAYMSKESRELAEDTFRRIERSTKW